MRAEALFFFGMPQIRFAVGESETIVVTTPPHVGARIVNGKWGCAEMNRLLDEADFDLCAQHKLGRVHVQRFEWQDARWVTAAFRDFAAKVKSTNGPRFACAALGSVSVELQLAGKLARVSLDPLRAVREGVWCLTMSAL